MRATRASPDNEQQAVQEHYGTSEHSMAGTWSGILSERQQKFYTDVLELEFGAVGRCLMCVCWDLNLGSLP